MISGTSMATPHIAGVAALLKQNHRDWTPGMIASALYTTAIPSDGLGNALLAYDKTYDAFGNTLSTFTRPGNSFDFGSGFVNAYAALDPGLIFNTSECTYLLEHSIYLPWAWCGNSDVKWVCSPTTSQLEALARVWVRGVKSYL